MKGWKLSPMDLKSREHWLEYSKAKDEMFKYTDTKQSPWYVVPADNKKKARLNCISHLLSSIDYQKVEREKIVLPPRKDDKGYIRTPFANQTIGAAKILSYKLKKAIANPIRITINF